MRMAHIDEQAAAVEMPCYQCHKMVWALKIASVARHACGGATIKPVEAGYPLFEVDEAYVTKHDPQPGGYYVVYEDGYKSFSPAQAFEQGYTRIIEE